MKTNESFLVQELDWVTRTILWRVEHYFNKSSDKIPVEDVVPPDPSTDDSAYANFIRFCQFGLEDRIGLMLTFIPLLRPQDLDCFNIRNSDTGCRFAEFGCREAGEGRVLLAGNAVVVTQYVAQLSTLVTADVEGAMVVIDAGVNGLERSIDGIALLVTANDVVAHAQGKGLLVVENVFNKVHTGSVPVCTCSWCLCPFLFVCNFLRINNL